MSAETRIGLLVGLAFIVCFAVILANREPRDRLAGQLPYSLLIQRDARASAPDDGGTDGLPSHPGNVRTPGSTLGDPSATPVGAGTGDAAPPPPPSSAYEGMRNPERTVHGTRSLARSETPTPTLPPTSALAGGPGVRGGEFRPRGYTDVGSDRAGGRLEAPDQRDIGSNRQELDALLARAAARMGQPDARGDRGAAEDGEVGGAIPGNGAPPPESRGDSPAGLEGGSVYTVVSGDTLSKIARRVYGTNSRRCIDALFEANRKTLKTADALSVGEVLVIPHVAGERVSPDAASSRGAGDARPSEGNDARRESGRPLGARRSAEHADAAGGAFRWYQVRAKDRYVSIAREQLGDGSRWKEIFDLNKDRFPDPDLIREGVRIKLPSASSVALAGDRR